MLEFTWLASYDATKTVTPNAKVIKFGDGYEQRQASGINRKPRQFSLTFTRKIAEIDAIEGFLSARGAVEAFKYNHPGQSAGVFVCREWKRTDISFGVHGLAANFDEVFE
jgi:phage-related protein